MCYAFLRSQIHLNKLGAFHFGAPEAMLWAIRPPNLERAFVEMCRFSRGRSPVSAPLVPNGEFILIPSEIVSPIAFERTLLRAATATPAGPASSATFLASVPRDGLSGCARSRVV